MATSGSIDYSVTRDDIITEALEQLGVLAEGDSPNASQLTSCGRTLNMMVKLWQADGLNLFVLEKLYLFLEKDVSEYSLSSSTTRHFTETTVETTLDGAQAAAATNMTVDSITGISNGDYIGVEVANNVVHWTTVNGAPSGSTVVLTSGLSAAASDGAKVFTYTSKANRPMNIVNCVIRDRNSNDIPVEIVTRDEYVDLPNKTSDGKVNQVWYDKQVSAGLLSVWPQSSVESDRLVLWVQRTVEDFDAAGDNPDYPQEWYLPLAFGLAKFLIPKYGVDVKRAQFVTGMADDLYDQAAGFDRPDSMFLEPEHD